MPLILPENSWQCPIFAWFCLGKNLAPYRIGKRPHKQNRGKIHQKYRKSYFFSIFDVFLGYFEGCYVFLSCRGPSLSQILPDFVLWECLKVPESAWCPESPRTKLGKSKRGLTNGGLSPKFSEKIGQNLGRHSEGRREGVELLKDLHRFLKKPPPS